MVTEGLSQAGTERSTVMLLAHIKFGASIWETACSLGVTLVRIPLCHSMRTHHNACNLKSLPDRFPVFKPDPLSPSLVVFIRMTILMIDVPKMCE